MSRAKREGTPEQYEEAKAAFLAAPKDPTPGLSIAELRADVDRILQEQGRAPRTPNAVSDAPDEALRRAHAHASRLPASVEGHGGDQALWHAARELAALGLSEADVVTVLTQTYSPRCTPPWDAAAIQWKAERAVAEHAAAFTGARGKASEARKIAQIITPEELQPTVDAMLRAENPYSPAVATADDPWPMRAGILSLDTPVRDYRIQEFEWGVGRPLGLLASYNASKTLTSKQILVDYALGRLILGKYAIGKRGTGRVLDLCYEQFTKAGATYTRLLRGAGIAAGELEDVRRLIEFGRPEHYLSDGMTRPVNPELRAYTEESLKQKCTGFDICNVDPYGAAALGLDEVSSAIQEPARMLERVSEATGCAFMICVHRGRDDEKEHSRGHSSLDDAFDTTILISKHDDSKPNTRLFKCLKRPMYGFEPEVLLIEDLNADGTAWERKEREESWGVRVRATGSAPDMSPALYANAVKVRDAAAREPGRLLTKQDFRELTGIDDGKRITPALNAAVDMRMLKRQRGPKNTYVYCYSGGELIESTGASAALDRAHGRAGSKYSGLVTAAGGVKSRTRK